MVLLLLVLTININLTLRVTNGVEMLCVMLEVT